MLCDAGVTQVAYVPDAGSARLIDLCHANSTMHSVALTTEEEGVALLAGAWLGGARGVLLMQSSGVGNCINMLSVMQECRFPLLALENSFYFSCLVDGLCLALPHMLLAGLCFVGLGATGREGHEPQAENGNNDFFTHNPCFL